MLAIIGWLLLVVLCAISALWGALAFVMCGIFNDKGGSCVGAIVFALALTGLYNTSNISPFTVTLDTHIYSEHK